MPIRFRDRADAGRRLAHLLRDLSGARDVVVLGLPRGGVPVAYEVAMALRAPLDVFLVRKLGVPGYEEMAMGAIASGGAMVLLPGVIAGLGVNRRQVESVARKEQVELERRAQTYRDVVPPASIRNATVVLVDDGVATGATMRAAVAAVRQIGAGRVIVAAPVMSGEALRSLSSVADRCECVAAPEPFGSVGAFYDDFAPTSDGEVRRLLAASRTSNPPSRSASASPYDVRITEGDVELRGDLTIPKGATAIVLFAHGSGSSRRSPRNQQVARALNARGFATLLFDLLTESEERADRASGHYRFDIPLLATRLVRATDWLCEQAETRQLAVGYFGASTGAAAALVAAATRPQLVRSVVSRGGRPDLAGAALSRVRAPSLLIVGANDVPVIALNRAAREQMRGTVTDLRVVANASHLFEEPGALEEVAQLAADWFAGHLAHHSAARVAGRNRAGARNGFQRLRATDKLEKTP